MSEIPRLSDGVAGGDQKLESEGNVPTIRRWIATAALIILVIAVWQFIDYRMRPPPPPTADNGQVISER